jgi:hypothetical protein
MGRFDALTELDKKPAQPTPLPEKTVPVQRTPPPPGDTASKPAKMQTGLPANLQARKDANQQTGKQVSLQTNLHANQQTSKEASRQAGKPTNQHTGKLVSLQSGKQVFIEKYSSYLPHEYKRELKRIALETDREGYEVLIEAVEQYLTQQKRLK